MTFTPFVPEPVTPTGAWLANNGTLVIALILAVLAAWGLVIFLIVRKRRR
jgi:hypothetical protein